MATIKWTWASLAIFQFIDVITATDLIAHGNEGGVVIISNGISNPPFMYGRDLYRDRKIWEGGFGTLNEKGMEQLYQVGKYLRNEYKHLLSDVFDPEQIRVTSIDSERAFMSAEAMLAGLYPVENSLRFDKDIAWRPSPVHPSTLENDYMLFMMDSCPKHRKLLNDFYDTEEVKTFVRSYNWIRSYVENYTGIKIAQYFFPQLVMLYDVLKTQKLNGKRLPDWTKKIFPEDLEAIANFSYKILTFSHEMTRLIIGLTARTIAETLVDMSNNATTKKLFVYSAHETTISYLLTAFGVMEGEKPPPGAFLNFLIEKPQDKYVIHIKYKRNVTSNDLGMFYYPFKSWLITKYNLFVSNLEMECRADVINSTTIWLPEKRPKDTTPNEFETATIWLLNQVLNETVDDELNSTIDYEPDTNTADTNKYRFNSTVIVLTSKNKTDTSKGPFNPAITLQPNKTDTPEKGYESAVIILPKKIMIYNTEQDYDATTFWLTKHH